MHNIKIAVKNLSLRYKNKLVLRNVNCEIKSNHVFAILGTSGSGKSTFLRCLNRMNDYEDECTISGSVLLDREEIYSKNYNVTQLRMKIGMVFQKPNPFNRSIRYNVLYGPVLCNMNQLNIEKILENSLKDAGLFEEVKERLNENASVLSGGQKQRLCIARAIATNPEVLLMDESCSALDPLSTQTIEKLIIKLKKKYTIVIVTHSVRQALKISDFVLFFDKGKLIEFNKTQDIFNETSHKIIIDYYNGHKNEF